MDDINFSDYRDSKKINVNVGRKVVSKIKKKGRAFGKNFGKSIVKDELGAANQYNAFIGHIGTGLGVAQLVQNIGNTGDVKDLAGAVGGVATGLGHLGFGLGAALDLIAFVQDKYSNRDGAHEKLQDYTWSLIDDAPPSKKLSKAAADAAMYLITEGEAQQAIGMEKLKKAEEPFMVWVTEYLRITLPFHHKVKKNLIAVNKERLKHLEKGFKRGGVVMKYMRRLNHWGNYIQSWEICALNIKGQSTFPDPFETSGAKTRKHLKDLSEMFLQHDKIFDEYMKKIKSMQASASTNRGQQSHMMGANRGHTQRGQNRNQRPGLGSSTFKPPGH